MNDTDLHTLTGAYALNALPPEEQLRFDQHLHTCATCAQEVRELTATAARLGRAVAEPVPPALRSRVLAQIENTRQLSPLGSTTSLQARAARRDRRWYQQPLAAAAALLAIVAMGLGAAALDAHRRADRAERIAAIAADPDAVTVTGSGPRGATAKVVAADGTAVFSVRELPELSEDQEYQLWVIGEDGPTSARSAGLLGQGGGEPTQRLVPGVDRGEALGVTVERRGGADQPTSSPLMLMRVTA